MTGTGRVAAAAAAIGLALLVTGTPAHAALSPSPAPVHTGLGIKLLDAPVALQQDPRAKIYVIDHVAQGASITRHVLVTNDTGAATTVALYPDAATVDDAGFEPGADHTTNQLTSWTRMSPTSLTLPAGGTGTITVTIAVPQTAASGERYGLLVAALPPAQRSGLLVEDRVGIRVYLSVGQGAAPRSDFTVSSLRAERLPDGRPAVAAKVTNIGQRALDMRGILTLDQGPGGLSAGPFTVQTLRSLRIGGSADVVVPLDRQVPAGPWRARMDLSSDELHHVVQATLSFPSGAAAPGVDVPVTQVLPKHRSLVIGVAAALVGSVVVFLSALMLVRGRQLRRRRRRSAPAAAAQPRDPVGAGRA